ncbi:MAG: hypothetical protein IJT14_02420 [Rickettsiales bacterium]|nr:hypothetical protein [Rickettsiales bacterium]
MINNNIALTPNEELTVVIDPEAWTHMVKYNELVQSYSDSEHKEGQQLPNPFSQLYFEDPRNKCILIRGCKDEYKKDNYGKIELIDEGKYCTNDDLHGEYKYEEIYNIITEQAKALGIDLNNIKKINIFDISHASNRNPLISCGFIDEKVNALKALNELCPNCEHAKIASTTCWGGRKDYNGKDLITEVKKSIEGNKNWYKNNIVEIDITPDDDNATSIVVGHDGKPHVSYCLDDEMYTKKHQPLPAIFTRHIHLLAKGKNNIYVPQEHKFQNNQYRVMEGEGGFPELSTQYIKQATQLKNIQTGSCHYGQLNTRQKEDGCTCVIY